MTDRGALLGACLALPFVFATAALGAPPDGQRTITVPPGAVVLIVPGAVATASPSAPTGTVMAAGDPFWQLVAQQDAMMHAMMARMNAAFAAPMFPPQMDQLIQAAMHGGLANGAGVCSERVTFLDKGDGSRPQVTVTRSGNACGGAGTAGQLNVMQAQPPERPQAPAVSVPHGPRLWTVGDPPQEVTTSGSPRT